MKSYKTLAGLIIAGSLMVQASQAQSFTPVSPGSFQAGNGDILIGFSSAALNKSYVIDIGTSFGDFTSLNVGVDLSSASAFGTSWNTISDLKWGVFGINYNLDTGAPVSAVASVASGAAALATKNATALNNADTPLSTIISQLNGDTALTYGAVQLNGDNGDVKGVNMWLGIADSATPFSLYNQSLTAGTGTTLDIYSASATTSTKVGQLAVDSSGNISAVPEPSTYALMGLGALLLVIAYRRKSNSNA
jgi:hypothetical protein